MDRVNEFDVEYHPALEALCTVTCVLHNQQNYRRHEAYHDPEKDLWDDVTTTDLYERYKPVLGASTTQQVQRQLDQNWTDFLNAKSKYNDPTDESITNRPRPPGYWGNRDDGYTHKWRCFIRKDAYSVEWGERSRLELLVGDELKARHGLDGNERLRVEIRGDPKWTGEQGQLIIRYDQSRDQFTAIQPVTVEADSDAGVDTDIPSEASGAEEAAVDVGANTLAAVTTTTGKQWYYEGRELFERFHETSQHIAEVQSALPGERTWSNRTNTLHHLRYNRRDHAQDALVRDLVERLVAETVGAVYVGKLTGVLATHWTAVVNEKTHLFWAYRRFIDRLESVAAEYGIDVVERSEALTTQTCPRCANHEATTRSGDWLHCASCGLEGHADVCASENFLGEQIDEHISRPMARPVRLTWNNHSWRCDQTSPHDEWINTSEERTPANPQVAPGGTRQHRAD